MISIEQVFIQTLQDLSSFYTDTPEDRYRKCIKQHPDLQQRISQYYITGIILLTNKTKSNAEVYTDVRYLG